MPGSSEASQQRTPSPPARPIGTCVPPGSCSAVITLAGDLHARPAGSLAVAAAKFDSAAELIVCDVKVDARSVLSVMSLGATSGQEVMVTATGPDAREAVDTIIGILAEATEVGR